MKMHASPNCAQSVEQKTHVSSFFLVQSHVLVSSFAMTHSKKNSFGNRDLSTNLDIRILLFSSFCLTIAEFNENRGCFFICLFLRLLQRYEEKPPPGQFFQSTVLGLGYFLFFPVNSLINSLFSRENKIALLHAAVTTQRVSWACGPIHFSHISAQVKLHFVV